MLSLRPIRRFCHAATVIPSTGTTAAVLNHVQNSKALEEPALVKLKAERDPEKLFHLFKANAHNRLVIENRFAFEDTVSRLAGARRFDYIEHLLEHQKTLPQGRREGFIIRIIMLYDMEKLGIKPDVVTYTTLISASYKDRRSEISNGLWNLMVLRGCLPNLTTFNVRIQHLIERRRAWDANKLMKVMRSIGIVPDEVTYNLVIKGFCQAGLLDMAKRVYSALHGSGYKPNVKIYQTMIHYLCKSGDFNLAHTICKDAMNKNWFPNIDTIHSLLKGLNKMGQAGKAQLILSLARKRIPPFSKTQLEALNTTLANS